MLAAAEPVFAPQQEEAPPVHAVQEGACRVFRSDAALSGLSADAFLFAGQPARLVLAFVSPHVDFRQVVCNCARFAWARR
jgi:hypothetical protein